MTWLETPVLNNRVVAVEIRDVAAFCSIVSRSRPIPVDVMELSVTVSL
jgi:hypothetical protein